MGSSLEGRSVAMLVVEPWELSPEREDDLLIGVIVRSNAFSSAVERETLVVELSPPVMWGGKRYRSLFLEPRDGDGLLQDMSDGRTVTCNFLGVPEAVRTQWETWVDTRWWRGGLAGTADVRLAEDVRATQGTPRQGVTRNP